MPMNFDFLKPYKKQIIFYSLLGLWLMALVMIMRPKTLVVFDLKGTYTAFFKQTINLKLSEEAIKKLGSRFPEALTRATNLYAQNHHAIVFTKAAVITGAEDVTPAIQKLIASEMQKLAR